MNDFLVVAVDESLDELVEVVLQLCLRDSFPFLDHLVEGVVGAYLQNDVYVLGVLEDMVEEEHIFVLKGLVYFDLGD